MNSILMAVLENGSSSVIFVTSLSSGYSSLIYSCCRVLEKNEEENSWFTALMMRMMRKVMGSLDEDEEDETRSR
ncbi:uncharacterized protein A4U43_C07F21040 [Asparagus officinalis]|uniref:Uncharacterized protein n=1 Tax=Asparagus officinalis TaxID=4686 RepID=A0A5P1EDM7_ASPOF|nr:uncharacterized protein A4U43_C07F21040 [Asparagus officinalis]